MAITVWCELVCDACAASGPGMHASRTLPKRKLIDSAKEHGWIITQDHAFCCRYCRDNHKGF